MDDKSAHAPAAQAVSPYLPLDPPVTKRSLSCLDLEIIMNDMRMLHDVVIDVDVHFEPNSDEHVAAERRERARLFWETLEKELETLSDPAKRAFFVKNYGFDKNWCLPRFLRTVNEILGTLVPRSRRRIVEEGLNSDYIMQKYYEGDLEVGKMAEWLSKELKTHCAPLRDEQVDRMAGLLKANHQEKGVRMLVEGLRELLTLLELMRLDATNHHIRSVRPMIVENIVPLEQTFFDEEVISGRMSIDGAKAWYDRTGHDVGGIQPCASHRVHVFFRGLTRLVLPSSNELISETFRHDHDRLKHIREAALHIVNMGICLRILDDLETPRGQHNESDGSCTLLRLLCALIHTTSHADPAHFWSSAVPFVAVEIGRCLCDNTQELIQSVEAQLRDSLCRYDSYIFQKTEDEFHKGLLHQVLLKVNDIKACRERHTSSSARLKCAALHSRMDNLASRIADIGILHWEVWKERAYKGS